MLPSDYTFILYKKNFYKKISLKIAKILRIFFKKLEKYLFVAKEIYAK